MQKRRNGRETLKAFSERALKATMDGTLIPPMVYIPVNLRKSPTRVQDIVTTNAKTADEIKAQIAEADPNGFLIALMQGQPIPSFVMFKREDGTIEVHVEFSTPDLLLRAEVAMELARRNMRIKSNHENDEYNAMIEKAADGIR